MAGEKKPEKEIGENGGWEGIKCSDCGKEIQSDNKLCKECNKKRLREKIIGANYDAASHVGKGKDLASVLRAMAEWSLKWHTNSSTQKNN